ncbi:MAG: thioredoxin-dependent thiol peroxidase [Bacteroidales bacterium]|nr:thioredoxin-dependent thiol peroxidase [Bacteroidales bacterium]
MALNIGDKAPEYLGKDQNGKDVHLSDFKDKKLVLYFYPKDNTPGCSAEACSFRDGYEDLLQKGYAIVGVSKDSEKSHQGFIEKKSLPFPLISDSDITLQNIFGVWQEKKMAGRTYMGTVRTTFIIGTDGVIENIITKVDTKDSANQVLNLYK